VLARGGVSVTETGVESEYDAGPVFVVDTASGDVIGEFEPTSGMVTDAQWSPDENLFYILSSGDQDNIDIVDLTYDQVVGSVAFREISLVGEAGLIAFHLDRG
jgi:hypothetical protein